MKVLLTGISGYIGSATADALLAAGHAVRGVVRTDAEAARWRARGVEAAYGDLARPATIARAAAGVDAAVWLATANDGAIDAPAVRALAGAMAGSGRALVYTSGIWVHGDTGGAEVDEDAPIAPAAIVAWRPAVERAVLDAPGLRGVVIRPAIAHGRGGGIPALMVGWAREAGVGRHVGDGRSRWPTVHVDDLADLYVRAVDRARAGDVLIGASGEAITADVARAAARAAGLPPVAEEWPLEDARRTLGAFADALALDQRASGARARARLGWAPSRPSLVEELTEGSYARR